MKESWNKPIEGETIKEFSYFCCYRDMPKEQRSVIAAFNIFQQKVNKVSKSSARWYKASHKNHWQSRVIEYDKYLKDLEIKDFVEEGRKEKRKNINALKAYRDKLLTMADEVDDNITWRELTNGLKMVIELLNKEYDKTEIKDKETDQVVVKVMQNVDFDDL